MTFSAPVDPNTARHDTILIREGPNYGVQVRGEFEAVSRKAAIYFRDIYDNMYRILDATYAYQDIVQGTLDAYLSSVNNALNHTMQRLTVIGAMLMPLTLITGIYGMNFKNMPELDWQYGYVAVLGLMVAVSIGLVTLSESIVGATLLTVIGTLPVSSPVSSSRKRT